MAKLEYGLTPNISQQLWNSTVPAMINTSEITSVRVKHIILNKKDKWFKKFGEWNSIGTIFYNSVIDPSPNDYTTNNFAKPLFPNHQNYPVLNEIVYIISLPNPDIQDNTRNKSQYYFQPINLWNSVHHNALPDNIWENDLPESQQKDYEQIEGGSARRVTDESTEINLGTYFKEQLNIRNLIPYEGDVIHQGRWGQSLRFSSTNPGDNTWSKNGETGNPITLIRNGQPDNLEGDSWVPISENINDDKSSIYLTSNQQIPIEAASTVYKSYDDNAEPDKPNEYLNNQVILNSGRLLFNSSTDSILLSSNKTINLNSATSVNIDAVNKMVIKTPKIYLGDKSEKNTQPTVLGDELVDILTSIISDIKGIGSPLESIIGNLGIPLIPTNIGAIKGDLDLNVVKQSLKKILQKNVRIIKNGVLDNSPTSNDPTLADNTDPSSGDPSNTEEKGEEASPDKVTKEGDITYIEITKS